MAWPPATSGSTEYQLTCRSRRRSIGHPGRLDHFDAYPVVGLTDDEFTTAAAYRSPSSLQRARSRFVLSVVSKHRPEDVDPPTGQDGLCGFTLY